MISEEKQIPVYYRGKDCGSAQMKKDGLYWMLDALCCPADGCVLRLYAETAEETICCGVLQPEGGSLRLRRRFAASGFPAADIDSLTAAESAGELWRPWSGRILDREVVGAVCRETNGRMEAALPLRRDGSFAPMAVFCTGQPRKIGGVWHLVWKIEQNKACGEIGDEV